MRTLVIGAGQVGPHVARQLADRGDHVVVGTRSGSGPDHPHITLVHLDATDPAALDRAFADVDVVHLCLHASTYRADVWERELYPLEAGVLAAAERHGVHVVYPESLYAFDTTGVVGAEPTVAPRTAMGRVRATLLERRAATAARTTSVVASDFYGPGAATAHGGDRMVGPATSGRTVRPLGRVDLLHAWTYLPDLAAAMVAAADTTEGPDVVLAPVVHASQRELALVYARTAGYDDVRVRAVPAWALRAVGVVNTDVRALAEMSYLFTEPLLVDETATILPATALDVAATAVVDSTSRSPVARS